ncbi:hypothetical protein FGIG_01936 [Fasciola gigantica]|uniref:Uncharacterized protein n=1 Tax=Fasciola gigantica TaxID=46835 RepID=A0A504YZN9_FASGI|nr:hypothetical protein FGIG_01936 [Fasciola gigantica]
MILEFNRLRKRGFRLVPTCITNDIYLRQRRKVLSNTEIWRRKQVASSRYPLKATYLRSGLVRVELPLLLPSQPAIPAGKFLRRIINSRKQLSSRRTNPGKKSRGSVPGEWKGVRPRSYIETRTSKQEIQSVKTVPGFVPSQKTRSSPVPVRMKGASSKLFTDRTKSEQLQSETLRNSSVFNLAPCTSPSRKCLAEDGKFYFFASSPDSLTTVRSEFVEPKIQLPVARLRANCSNKQYSAVCPVVIGDIPSRNCIGVGKTNVQCDANGISEFHLDASQPDTFEHVSYSRQAGQSVTPGLSNVAECVNCAETESFSQLGKGFTPFFTKPITNRITNKPVTSAKMTWKSYPCTMHDKSPKHSCFSPTEQVRTVGDGAILLKTSRQLVHSMTNIMPEQCEKQAVEMLASVFNKSVSSRGSRPPSLHGDPSLPTTTHSYYNMHQPIDVKLSPVAQSGVMNRLGLNNEAVYTADQIHSRISSSQCDTSFATSDFEVAMDKNLPDHDLSHTLRKSCGIDMQEQEEAVLVTNEPKTRRSVVYGEEALLPCTLEVCTYASPMADPNIEQGRNSLVDEDSEPVDYSVFARKNSSSQQFRLRNQVDLSTSVTELSTPSDYRGFRVWSSLSMASPVLNQFQWDQNQTLSPISVSNITESKPNVEFSPPGKLYHFDAKRDADGGGNYRASSIALHSSGLPLDVKVTEHSLSDSQFSTPVISKGTVERTANDELVGFSLRRVGDVLHDSECLSEEPSTELDTYTKPCSESLDVYIQSFRDCDRSHSSSNPPEKMNTNLDVQSQTKRSTVLRVRKSGRVQSVSPNIQLTDFAHIKKRDSAESVSGVTESNKTIRSWKRLKLDITERPTGSGTIRIYSRQKGITQPVHSLLQRKSNYWKTKFAHANPLSASTLARRVLALCSSGNPITGVTESKELLDTNNSNSCMLNEGKTSKKNRVFPPHLSLVEKPCFWEIECAPQLQITPSSSSVSIASKSVLTEEQFVKMFLATPHRDTMRPNNMEVDNGDTAFIDSSIRRASGTMLKAYALTGSRFIVPECYFTTEDMSMDMGDLESNNWAEFDESSCSVPLDEPELLQTDSSSSTDGRVNCSSAPSYFWYLNEADIDSWIPFREMSEEGRGDDLLGELDILDFNYLNQVSLSQSAFLSFDGATDYSEADSFIPSQLALSAGSSQSDLKLSQNEDLEKTLSMQSMILRPADSDRVLDTNELNLTDPKQFISFSDHLSSSGKDENRTLPAKTTRTKLSIRKVSHGITRSVDSIHKIPDSRSDPFTGGAVTNVHRGSLIYTSATIEMEPVRLVRIQTTDSSMISYKNDHIDVVFESQELVYTAEQLVWMPQMNRSVSKGFSAPCNCIGPRTLGLIPSTNYILLEKQYEVCQLYENRVDWKTGTAMRVQISQSQSTLCDQIPLDNTLVQCKSSEVMCTDQYKSDVASGIIERQVETVCVSSPLWILARRGSEPPKRSGLCFSTRRFSNTFKSAWIRFKSPYRAPENVYHPDRMLWEKNIDCLPTVRRKRISEASGPIQWKASQIKESTMTAHRVHRARGIRMSSGLGPRTSSYRRIQSHEYESVSRVNPIHKRVVSGRPSSLSLNRRVTDSRNYGLIFRPTTEQMRSARYLFTKPRSTYLKQNCKRRTKTNRDKPATALKKTRKHTGRVAVSEPSFRKEQATRGSFYHDSLFGEIDRLNQMKRSCQLQFRSLKNKPVSVACQTMGRSVCRFRGTYCF